ncbi:unnamed protein product [Schistosoma margrebowiei]|uniref:Uncharacterized protein n=1 Tax=Schistosoma margrebowiei TaxID=48269 RepID=A0A183LS29_9TREM|nr:unnamed protein product [Schistosoma margrebowiei]
MESPRPKEKRKTKEHITSRNGDIHEKNEQKLDRAGKEGSCQSGLKNASRRPMLDWRNNNPIPIILQFRFMVFGIPYNP